MQPAPPSVADAALTTSLILEEQNELFDAYYARYRTSVEARRASLARPAEPSPSPSPPIGLARAPSMAAGVNLVEMLQTAKRINEPERRVLLEDTGDTVGRGCAEARGGAPPCGTVHTRSRHMARLCTLWRTLYRSGLLSCA